MSGLLCLSASLYAQPPVPQQVKDWQQAATQLYQAGDLTGARAEYEKIIQAYPDKPYAFDAYAQVARLYVEEKQFEQIAPLVAQLCPIFYEHRGIFRLLSDLVKDSMYANAYPQAIAICDEVKRQLSTHPRQTLLIGLEGMVYAHQGNFEKAEQQIQILHEQESIASDFLDAMKDIGWGYFCAGRLAAAAEIYRRGLRRYPDHPNAVYLQYHIVQAFLRKGDLYTADKEMEALLTQYAHRANTPGLAARLARDYRRQGYAQQALSIYQTLLERFPEHGVIPEIRDAIVETYADIGDLASAREALKINIAYHPGRRELVRMITHVAVESARAGEINEAMKLVPDIFEQAPEGPDQLFAYTTLARIYVHQGKDAEAETTINEILKRFKDYPDDVVYHLFGVGEEYYYLAQKASSIGNIEEAKVNCKMTISLLETYMTLLSERHYQNRSKTYFIMALCYRQLGEWWLAADAFTKSVEVYPYYKHADYCLHAKADCFKKLMESETISVEKAISIIKKTYYKLVSKYPESIYVLDAILWLQKN
ncbi:MAG TPA: tetratricopeptide repeat protein [Chloroflexi bacterium]|nr:tetratricopeptide repeat protein [Chloroflexota bacterium]